MSVNPKPESKPTKALTVFLTGATAWAGMYLSKPVAGAIAVITATLLVFVVPNNAKAPFTGDAGFVDSGGLVMLLIGFLLGVLCVKAGVL